MSGQSIYDVSNWAQNTNYDLYDIYKYNNQYYYAIAKHNSGIVFNSQFSDGIITYNNLSKPYFFFTPAYNNNDNIKPFIKKVQFGDGYSQSNPDGINNILLSLNLTFDKRSNSEARAILHFLHTRKGTESFVFTPPFPYNSNKLFKCEQWDHSQKFANHHIINVLFTEVVV